MMRVPTGVDQPSVSASSGVEEGVLTPRMWLLSIWVMTTFAAFRSRPIDALLGGNAIDGQVVYQAASWFGFAALAVWCIFSGRFDRALIDRGPLRWYLLFSGLALASSLYSASPLMTAYYAVQNITLVVLACSTGPQPIPLYRLIIAYVLANWAVLGLGAIGLNFGLSWITTAQESYLRYGGSLGELWRFSTAFGHPSILSVVAAIGAVGISARGKLSLGALVAIAFLVLTVLLTLSRTAIVGMAAGLFVVAMRRGMLAPLCAVIFLSTTAVLCVPGLDDDLLNIFMRGQTSEEFSSLTGRAEIYSVAIQRANESWAGEGFRSLRGKPLLGETWGQGVSHAHNLVLQALIDLGYVGAFIVLAALIALILYGIQLAFPSERDEISDVEILAVSLPVMAFCILDSGFAVNVNVFIVIFVLICVRATLKVHHAAASNLAKNSGFRIDLSGNRNYGARRRCPV